jgi:hypothetical protein
MNEPVSRGGVRRGALVRAGVWLGVSWLACGGVSNDGLETPGPALLRNDASGGAPAQPPLDAGVPDAASNDAGSSDTAQDCRGAPCSECPQLLTSSPDYLGPTTAWGRNPYTGTCCPYANSVFMPDHFPSFESLEACEGSCRCAELVGSGGSEASWITERISLECYCSAKTCDVSPEAFGEDRCSRGLTVVRSEGCGLLQVATDVGNGDSESRVFGQASRALVGAGDGSDVSGFPCRTYGTSAGTEFDCPKAEVCLVCGPPGDPRPACD